MKASELHMTHEYGRGWQFCVHVSEEAVGTAKMLCDKFKDEFVEIQVEKWSDKRSLQANAYFHVLVNKLSEAMKSSMDDVKKMLVSEYGTLARGKDGKYMAVKVPSNTDIQKIYPYVKYIGEDENGLDMYLFFKRTSDLNKDEMNQLISGTVYEAKQLNIETLTPAELEQMMNRWRKE